MRTAAGRPRGRQPGHAPRASAIAFALGLGALALLAAIGLVGPDEARVNAVGTVPRIVIGVVGGCCLVGAVLLVPRHPAGRTLAALGGGTALVLPLALAPLFVVAPAELALGIRQSGGLLVHLAVLQLGLVTMIQALRRP